MSILFQMIDAGHVKPIAPIHQFSFADIPSAIRFLRAGKHIGKVVISDGAEAVIKVPVSHFCPCLLLYHWDTVLMHSGPTSAQNSELTQ